MTVRAGSEKDLQQTIVQFLQLEELVVLEFGKPGSHRALAGAVPPGWPDLLVIMPRQEGPAYLHIELKVGGRWLSMIQEDMHARLREVGCKVYVVRCLEDAVAVLRAHGHVFKVGLKEGGL